jgi:hypothetical protein
MVFSLSKAARLSEWQCFLMEQKGFTEGRDPKGSPVKVHCSAHVHGQCEGGQWGPWAGFGDPIWHSSTECSESPPASILGIKELFEYEMHTTHSLAVYTQT